MKIGFFGGAFDPFHNEHKNLVICALQELELDKIVVYPSYLPPHKTCTAPYESRKELAKIALRDVCKAEVSDVERLSGRELNPTSEIIPILKKMYPAEEHYFIIGGDSLLNFDKWIRPDLIAREVKIVAAARESLIEAYESAEAVRAKYGADVSLLGYVGKRVSGSSIKAEIELGIKPDELDGAVYEKINEYGLYREHADIIEKLKRNLSAGTLEHVKRTVLYAMKLNVKQGLPYEKVFLAALLHDCAKHIHRTEEGDMLYAVEHQFIGRELAKELYGITDADVLSAIEYHTTGKSKMSSLEKLIFCADMLEEGRSYDGVDELRATIEADFERGFVCCVNRSLEFLKKKGCRIYPLTEECARYYNNTKS